MTATTERAIVEAALEEIERTHQQSGTLCAGCSTSIPWFAEPNACPCPWCDGNCPQALAVAWPCPPVIVAKELRRLRAVEDAAIAAAAEHRCVYCPHPYGVHSDYRCWRCTEEGRRGDSADHPFTTPAEAQRDRQYRELRERVAAKRAASYRDAGEPDPRALLD